MIPKVFFASWGFESGSESKFSDTHPCKNVKLKQLTSIKETSPELVLGSSGVIFFLISVQNYVSVFKHIVVLSDQPNTPSRSTFDFSYPKYFYETR